MSNLLLDTNGICLVTDESYMTDINFFNKIDLAVEAGIDVIQVRSKAATPIQFYELAHKIRILFPSIKLIVNNNIEVALAVNAEAIQLGESSMSPEAVRFKIENRLYIGKSVHSINSAINAEKSGVDYLIVGTIFPSNSHPGYEPSGVDLIKKITSKVSIPVLGIGGITNRNCDSVINQGAFGVAIISEIMQSQDVYQAAKTLIDKVQYCKLQNK
ncbi:MAG: thiamine phosphate synthase [SAR202 cluster bacterium]|nr:thiamine phosphate synthase [Chloroflexota bacterium]MQG51687.1 thiamine phosphate synthase [SAR202 cluster bacterium]|tara:strand:+ start:924 stop:1568 length:645 start_codon:yes stop_codon:yes gene_type:complete